MALSNGPKTCVPELKDPSLLKSLGLIGGKWVGAHDGKTMPVRPEPPRICKFFSWTSSYKAFQVNMKLSPLNKIWTAYSFLSSHSGFLVAFMLCLEHRWLFWHHQLRASERRNCRSLPICTVEYAISDSIVTRPAGPHPVLPGAQPRHWRGDCGCPGDGRPGDGGSHCSSTRGVPNLEQNNRQAPQPAAEETVSKLLVGTTNGLSRLAILNLALWSALASFSLAWGGLSSLELTFWSWPGTI